MADIEVREEESSDSDGDCTAYAVAASLIGQDLRPDQRMAREFRATVLRHLPVGCRIIGLCGRIERRMLQVRRAMSPDEEETVRIPIEKLVNSMRSVYRDPSSSEITITPENVAEVVRLSQVLKRHLTPKEQVMLLQGTQVMELLTGKTPSELLEAFKDPRLAERIPTGLRLMGNLRNGEVHDLDDLAAECRADEVILSKQAVFFEFAFKATAKERGYQACPYCLERSSQRQE